MNMKCRTALVAAHTLYCLNGQGQTTLSDTQLQDRMPYSFTTNIHSAPERPADTIPEDARCHFSKHFETTAPEKWMSIVNGYVASFSDRNTRTRVYYNAAGKYLGYLKGFLPDLLPKDLFMNVTSAYPEFDLMYVEEAFVAIPGTVTYFVQMQRGGEIRLLRIMDEEIAEIKGPGN